MTRPNLYVDEAGQTVDVKAPKKTIDVTDVNAYGNAQGFLLYLNGQAYQINGDQANHLVSVLRNLQTNLQR